MAMILWAQQKKLKPDPKLVKEHEKYKNKNLKPTLGFKFIIITDTTDERLERICEVNRIGLIIIEGGVNIQEIVPYMTL